jgi:hypothetical protein
LARALSTTNPSFASRIAGAMTSASDIVPCARSASVMPATAPGTPDARCPTVLLSVSFPLASTNMFRVAASGAISR